MHPFPRVCAQPSAGFAFGCCFRSALIPRCASKAGGSFKGLFLGLAGDESELLRREAPGLPYNRWGEGPGQANLDLAADLVTLANHCRPYATSNLDQKG